LGTWKDRLREAEEVEEEVEERAMTFILQSRHPGKRGERFLVRRRIDHHREKESGAKDEDETHVDPWT
jgi:hypothetical protein